MIVIELSFTDGKMKRSRNHQPVLQALLGFLLEPARWRLGTRRILIEPEETTSRWDSVTKHWRIKGLYNTRGLQHLVAPHNVRILHLDESKPWASAKSPFRRLVPHENGALHIDAFCVGVADPLSSQGEILLRQMRPEKRRLWLRYVPSCSV